MRDLLSIHMIVIASTCACDNALSKINIVCREHKNAILAMINQPRKNGSIIFLWRCSSGSSMQYDRSCWYSNRSSRRNGGWAFSVRQLFHAEICLTSDILCIQSIYSIVEFQFNEKISPLVAMIIKQPYRILLFIPFFWNLLFLYCHHQPL